MATESYHRKIARMEAMALDPSAQAEYASELVRRERNPEAVVAAIRVLGRMGDDRYWPTLRERYWHCDANGQRRDQGGGIRTEIVYALRSNLSQEDGPLLERAVTTWEVLFGESASDLRAAGLVVLNELDDVLAGYHAINLLWDKDADSMTGEPAATAVRVLASQGQFLPIYALLASDSSIVSDVLAEAMRNLTELPEYLLDKLVERYRERQDEILLLGLFDLIFAHPSCERYAPFVIEFLVNTDLINLFRYIVRYVFAEHYETVTGGLVATTPRIKNTEKLEVLREAIGLETRQAPGKR